MDIQREHIRKQLNGLATDLASSTSRGEEKLLALWILYRLRSEKVVDSDLGLDSIREAHRESMEIIESLRQQVLDKDQLIYSMTNNAFDLAKSSTHERSLDEMIHILANQRISEDYLHVDAVKWDEVHRCMLHAPVHLVTDYQSAKRKGEWLIVRRDGSGYTTEEHINPYEDLRENVAALYRFTASWRKFEGEDFVVAKLVWERRFAYLVQMSEEQFAKIKKG